MIAHILNVQRTTLRISYLYTYRRHSLWLALLSLRRRRPTRRPRRLRSGRTRTRYLLWTAGDGLEYEGASGEMRP